MDPCLFVLFFFSSSLAPSRTTEASLSCSLFFLFFFKLPGFFSSITLRMDGCIAWTGRTDCTDVQMKRWRSFYFFKDCGASKGSEGKGRGMDGWREGGIEGICSIHALRTLHTYTHTHIWIHVCMHVWRLPATPVDFERFPLFFSYMHTSHHIHTWQGGGCCFAT